MNVLNSFNLKFRDSELEARFSNNTLARTRYQGRVAIFLGTLVYLFYGLLDMWFVPADHQSSVWLIRLSTLCVPAAVFILTFTPWFARVSYLSLALVGLTAGFGFISMLQLVPLESFSLYYPGMVLVTFYTYNLVGTRFIYALAVDLILLASYNIIFAWWRGYPLPVMVSHDFFIISANFVGGTAGYLQEYQLRQLFEREQELEKERQVHLTKSMHDSLTGLPNRDLLYDRLTQAIAKAHRNNCLNAAYFIDLDDFKKINDQLGHETGDQMLKIVSATLSDMMRNTDTVARLGGDEFFVLANDIGDIDKAEHLAEKMNMAIRSATAALNKEYAFGASIGICLFPYSGNSVEDIIRRADQAMYIAKQDGKGMHSIRMPI